MELYFELVEFGLFFIRSDIFGFFIGVSVNSVFATTAYVLNLFLGDYYYMVS